MFLNSLSVGWFAWQGVWLVISWQSQLTQLSPYIVFLYCHCFCDVFWFLMYIHVCIWNCICIFVYLYSHLYWYWHFEGGDTRLVPNQAVGSSLSFPQVFVATPTPRPSNPTSQGHHALLTKIQKKLGRNPEKIRKKN